MRTSKSPLCALLLGGSASLLGCASPDPGDAGSTTDATPGSLEADCLLATVSIGGAFPPLGGECRSHIVYFASAATGEDRDNRAALLAEPRDHAVDPTGVRPMLDHPGFFDLGQRSTSLSDFWLGVILPSLEPGHYERPDRTAVRRAVVWTTGTDTSRGTLELDVVGRNAEAIWGRFLAKICSEDPFEACVYMNARFSAQVEAEPSDDFFGAPPVAAPNQGHFCFDDPAECPEAVCGQSLCIARGCELRGTPSECPADTYCDPAIGCVP